MAKRLPLPMRFPAAVTGPAHARLRALGAGRGLWYNHLPAVLLQRPDDHADAERPRAPFRDFVAGRGAPGAGDGAR